ncbi:DUF1990 family protein [Nocardioides sp. Kera G14]|uniref:DUF1990 family protein n=1 Tax=Nocardioides sp. Kera G14 TaxID=2884264 RepID=UPI001D12B844|nr:DUF1990 domain-containing protein [Nocardioides sp. Kera G14]UDY24709.1 DUF1990 domain-containing protein [Nocardioides sp. Kera G14]
MRLLSETEQRRLRQLPLTYDEIGMSLAADLPLGYRHVRRSVPLPPTTEWSQATKALFAWQVQEGAGLTVRASGQVEQGAVVEMRLGVGPVAARPRCLVVAVIDEPDRVGFAYGTLEGHPESGEEAFLITRTSEGIQFRVTAFSRPATALGRLAKPVAERVQDAITERYLRALSQP